MKAGLVCKKTRLCLTERIFRRHFYWIVETLLPNTQGLTTPNTPARVDVVEDKDAYHFYIEMPGLRGDSIDVQVEDDSLVVAARVAAGDPGLSCGASI